MNRVNVSIIVPVYNSENILRYCLESIATQTYRDLEVLLIDDGSTDSSGSICDEYGARDSRFRVFHTENNGIAAAQNIGLDQAKGTLIAFVDNDDILARQNIEYLVKAIQCSKADLSKARWKQFGLSELKAVVNEARSERFMGQLTAFENPIKKYGFSLFGVGGLVGWRWLVG